MENKNSQIKVLFAKAYKYPYYEYSINSLESSNLAERKELSDLVYSLSSKNYARLSYLIERFLPFVYDFEENELIEISPFSDIEDEKQNIFTRINTKDEPLSMFEKLKIASESLIKKVF
jgi:hypothetical protein